MSPARAWLCLPARPSDPVMQTTETPVVAAERRSITELKGRHTGADIWLVAAGASMNYVDPGFFDGKITVGVNAVHRRFRCTYLVLRTMALAEEAVRSGA